MAEFDKDILLKAMQGFDLIFIVTGLGGGTGTGAAPYISQLAKNQGALVIVFATIPFTIEGCNRNRLAEAGLVELRSFFHAVIPLPNDLLLQQFDQDTTVLKALHCSNEWIQHGINSILGVMYKPGIINLDFSVF